MSSELAEQLIRLRRFRGLSQQQLAEAIGTKQAAISRHESGAGNISVQTLEAILAALDAVCRIDLIPGEMEEFRASFPRWWVAEADKHLYQSSSVWQQLRETVSATAPVPQASATSSTSNKLETSIPLLLTAKAHSRGNF